jgi:uncharacterized membrane protein YhaH (DUF805 family)
MDLYRLYLTGWRKAAVYSGRAPRREYWCFVLANVLIVMLAAALIVPNLGPNIARDILAPFLVAVVVAQLAMGVRRLHDVGYSGWFMLLELVPLANLGLALVLFFWPSQGGRGNRYGAYPWA